MRVFITGASGTIGKTLTDCLRQNHEIIGIDKKSSAGVRVLDIVRDTDEIKKASEKTDAVIHLAWDTKESGASLQPPVAENKKMAEIMLAIALENKIPKFILASSVHVSFGHIGYTHPGIVQDHNALHGKKITENDPPKPQGTYGASKIYLEELAEAYSSKGLGVIAARFGNVTPDNGHGEYPFWLSHRDLCQFIEKCLLAQNLRRFSVFYAISDNACNPFSLEKAKRELGYAPEDAVLCPLK